MGVLLFFIITSSVIVIGNLIYLKYRKHRFSQLLLKTAGKYGLDFIKHSKFQFPAVSGRISHYPVHIKQYRIFHKVLITAIVKFTINIEYGKLPIFSITPENFISQVKKIFGQTDILIGDENFDKKALIRGYDAPRLYILLNKQARSLINNFINSAAMKNFKISEDKIEYNVRLLDILIEEDIENILDNLIRLAGIICRKATPIDLLKENFLIETENGAKKKLLKTLYSLEGYLPPADPVMIKALCDPDYEIQFLGAILLKEHGYNKIKTLYTKGDEQIKKIIINYYKNDKNPLFFDFFLNYADKEADIVIKKELVDYFRVIGDAKAEPFLQKELNIKQDNESIKDFLLYKFIVIYALKYCGTYESIESLFNFKKFALKREVDEAIAAIQNRIGSGEKGWLSINTETDNGGQLSLTDRQGEDDDE